MKSLTNKRKEADKSKFNIIEYAVNNTFNRHKFKQEYEPINVGKNEPVFESYFLHSGEITNYFNNNKDNKGNKTLAEYSGYVYSNDLKIDIDEKDKSLQQVRELLRFWESEYDVDLRYIRVNFSGSKGFHIRIPAELFDGFEPSDNLPQLHKQIALKLTEGVKIDETVYRTTGLFRAVNSINIKSGLFAIPLTYQEVFSLSYDDIKSLAVEQRFIDYIDPEELSEVEALAELKSIPLETTTVNLTHKNYFWDDASEGNRFETLTSAVGRLIRTNLSNDDIMQLGLILNNQHSPPKDEATVRKIVKDLLNKYGNLKGSFWCVKRYMDKKDKGKIEVTIDLNKFIKYLNDEGFAKIYFDKNLLFIKVNDNIISESSVPLIKDHVMNKLKEEEKMNNPYKEDLQNKMLNGVSKYFNSTLLECISTKELTKQRDEKNSAYINYKNGFVTLEKGKTPVLRPLSDISSPIWEKSIIQRDINLLNHKAQPSEFEVFLRRAMKGSEERFLNLCSTIGYLLHGFKDESNAKAIILCDEKISDEPNGRSGKSLVGKAIRQIKTVANIDGKNFEFGDRFTFQSVDLDTKIIDFNDVKKDFNFERLFSVLTDDMNLEYKQQHPIKLSFKDSPKVMLSTDDTIKGNSGSFKDRMLEIEFSDHYNEYHKPIDEFKHLFFQDWDEEEWNKFDNFMLECLQLYLDEGFIGCAPLNLEVRKLRDQTNPEFLEYVKENVVLGSEYNLKELYDRFKKFLGYEFEFTNPCPIKQNTFTDWLKTYSEFKHYNFSKRASNGRQLVMLNIQ